MKNPLAKIPFLFLLIPLLIGILLQYYFSTEYLSMAFALTGTMAMLFSYLIAEKYQFSFRWLFGFGAFLFIVAIGIFSTELRQQKSEFIFPDMQEAYYGIVTDTPPQEKPNTTAYRVYLPDLDKQIVCYFQRDTLDNNRLLPGEQFLFFGAIQPFRNMGNPDDFDYVKYMYDQGFAGSVYLNKQSWKSSGDVSYSLKYLALRCRQQIMNFYKSLGFTQTEYSILSALTLGYQNDLTDDIKQGFRTTGTVHVLSVSGLHVGIIYLIISFLLGFICRSSKYYWIKPCLIILLLWCYAFITGLPVSVVRASLMLSVFCVSEIFEKKSFSIHALFIAAFFILLINPFSLFDVGFQLSFISVLSILYLLPKVSGIIKTENKYLRNVWQLFALSLVAQLATFPLCLYYFGTFPTYFFIGNLLIVPLVSFITYAVAGIAVAKLFSLILPDLSYYFYYLPVKILQLLVWLMTAIIRLIEDLPYALIDNVEFSFTDLVLMFTMIISGIFFFVYKRSKALLVSLSVVVFIFSIHIYDNLRQKPDLLTVYNRRQSTEIRLYKEQNETILNTEDLSQGYYIPDTRDKNTLILSSDKWDRKRTGDKLCVDNLILTNDNNFSLYSLTELFIPARVVLDGSLSIYTRRRLSKECKKLNIPCHDVVENGAFSLFFSIFVAALKI